MAPVRILNPGRLIGSDGAPVVVNLDQWDGYAPQRTRLLRALGELATPNPVVLSGDIHSAWVNDLRAEAGSAPVATELVTTSISSVKDPRLGPLLALSNVRLNPHVRFFDARHGGYLRMTVDARRWRSELRLADDPTVPGSPVRTAAVHEITAGTVGARRV